MNENFYEVELREALGDALDDRRISVVDDSSPFFSLLMQTYPMSGSRIDWHQVPNSVEEVEEDNTIQLERFLSFFDEMVHKYCLNGEVVYIGDSATSFALSGQLECLREALPKVLTIPQHHYLIESGAAWCMCFTMEGDMGFGLRPTAMK